MSATRSRATTLLLLVLFGASGFAALLYQVIWQRMLALFSGADVFSVTVVVSAFMAGLGVGNLAGGHLADRVRRRSCLALFAAAELAVGAFALLSKYLYYDLLYARFGASALSMPALAVVLFVAVAWPTFFMGVSLPLLARGLTSTLAAAARTVGSLYGWNTLGAACGALVTTWILLRRFDFETCLLIGAGLNFACAVLVIFLMQRTPEDSAPTVTDAAQVPAPTQRTPLFGVGGWVLLYALSGGVALALEITWFRTLGVILKSTSFTFGTLLAIFLLGVGGGSIVGAWWVERSRGAPAARFLSLQAAIPIYAGLAIAALVLGLGDAPALGTLWRYLGTDEPLRIDLAIDQLARHPWSIWTPETVLDANARFFAVLYGLVPLLLIGPPTFMMGLSFPFLQRAVQTDASFLGRRVGWLQTANIAGSLAGSLAAGFVLLPSIGTAGTFQALALLGIPFAALRVRAVPRAGLRASLALGAAALLVLVLVPRSGAFWAPLHAVEPERILAAEDAAGLSLIKPVDRDTHVVMAGGLSVSSFPYGAYEGIHTALGVLPVLLHPEPRRVLVIGMGSGDTSFAAGARALTEEIVTVEIVGSQFEVLRAFHERSLHPGLDTLFSDARFRSFVGDGRAHVLRDRDGFDVIEADALRPSSSYAGNLYSLEYFALLRDRLRPGGFAVSWLPTPRVRNTFLDSFPHVVIVGSIAIGSSDPIRFDREEILERSRDPRVRAYFERVGVDIGELLRQYLRRGEVRRLGPELDRSGYARDVNRDLFAKDEFMIRGQGR